MSHEATHQVGNVGSVFVFEILDQVNAVVDISTATTLDCRFRSSPDAATFTRTGVLHTDGTDGKIRYVSIAGDLTPAGECWQRQAFVVVPGLGEFSSFVRSFVVKPNL